MLLSSCCLESFTMLYPLCVISSEPESKPSQIPTQYLIPTWTPVMGSIISSPACTRSHLSSLTQRPLHDLLWLEKSEKGTRNHQMGLHACQSEPRETRCTGHPPHFFVAWPKLRAHSFCFKHLEIRNQNLLFASSVPSTMPWASDVLSWHLWTKWTNKQISSISYSVVSP